MRVSHVLRLLAVLLASLTLHAQDISAPLPQTGSIQGYAADVDGSLVPGAVAVAQGPAPDDKRTATSDTSGLFTLTGIRPFVTYKVTVSFKGFKDWVSPEFTLGAGQKFVLDGVKLPVAEVTDSVSAETSEQIAIEEEKAEEHQRVFGVLPNFYVVYSSVTAPLSTKLKYKLAYKSIIDPVNFLASMFVAGLEQASDEPDYVQGAKGYGQRVGAIYANGLTDILIGGAVLPSLLHQDPRYFYKGTGGKKARTLHALGSPFFCRGDNGKEQFNYSSVGGDLASGAISNLYYPTQDRGVGLVFENALITTGGRMVNALLQEFVLSRFTTKAKVQH